MKNVILTGVVAGVFFRMLMLGLGPARLKVEVAPRLCASPCSIRVLVKVIPDADNRGYVVSVSGDNYESSSAVPLEGVGAAYTQPYLWFKDLPSGIYEVDCTLQTWERTVARLTQTVEVW